MTVATVVLCTFGARRFGKLSKTACHVRLPVVNNGRSACFAKKKKNHYRNRPRVRLSGRRRRRRARLDQRNLSRRQSARLRPRRSKIRRDVTFVARRPS